MIKLISLCKIHKGRKNNEIEALKNINLQLPSKGFIVLTGGNGSGKSTLLSILGGLDSITTGHFMVKGQNFSNLQQHELDDWRGRNVSYVFQEYNILSNYTVAENVALGKRLLGEEASKEEIISVLEKVGLQAYENRYLKELSSGEKQKVAIARALIKKPKLILVDEPTAYIDEDSAKTILALLGELSKEVLVVAATHQNTLFKKHADRVIVMEKGTIKSDSAGDAKRKIKEENTTVNPLIEKPRTFKIACEMGVKSFSKNWKISLISALTTAFSLLFFAVFLMLASFNRFDTLATDALNTNHNYYIFNGENIRDKDIQSLKSALGERPLISFINYGYNGISGIVEVPQKGTSTTVFGQDILYKDSSTITSGVFGENLDKIMITDFLANKIINKAIIVYDSEGNEYPHDYAFTTAFIASGAVYMKLGITPHEDLNNLYAISAIVGTDWQQNYNNTTSTQFKYSMIYAPVGFVSSNLIDTQVGKINVSDVGHFQGRVVNKKPVGYITKRIDGKDSNEQLADNEVIVSNNLWLSLGRPLQKKEISFSVLGGSLESYTVVGYYSNHPSFNSTILIEMNNNQFFEKEYNVLQTTYPVSKLLFLTDNVNSNNLAKIINTVENYSSLQFDSENATLINEFSDKINIFKNTFLFFAIFSLLLSGAFFYSHITTLINERKKDIGILRALGARSKMVFINLFTSVAVIAVGAFLLSGVLSVLSLIIINTISMSSLGFNVITFNALQLLVIFLTCIIVAGVATFLPVFKYSKQTPVKQIK